MGGNKPYRIRMEADQIKFLTSEVPKYLNKLKSESSPKWGIMSAQHMVEHLIYILENSSDKREMELLIPKEKLERSKAFLLSDYGLVPNFKFPLLPEGKTVPLKFGHLTEALNAWMQELDYFLSYVDDESFKTVMHPFFGSLNREEISLFQYKHHAHHLMQFGLLDFKI